MYIYIYMEHHISIILWKSLRTGFPSGFVNVIMVMKENYSYTIFFLHRIISIWYCYITVGYVWRYVPSNSNKFVVILEIFLVNIKTKSFYIVVSNISLKYYTPIIRLLSQKFRISFILPFNIYVTFKLILVIIKENAKNLCFFCNTQS